MREGAVTPFRHIIYWKTNFIGDHGTWVTCGHGPQI